MFESLYSSLIVSICTTIVITMAFVYMQISRVIPFFTELAFPPSWITTGVVSTCSLVKKMMVGVILTYYQTIIRNRAVVVDLSFLGNWFSKSFTSYNSVLKNITLFCCHGVVRITNIQIPRAPHGFSTVPSRVFLPVFGNIGVGNSSPVMSVDEPYWFSFNESKRFKGTFCNAGFSATPTLTKTFGDFSKRGILVLSHVVLSFQRMILVRAGWMLTHLSGSSFYRTYPYDLQGFCLND